MRPRDELLNLAFAERGFTYENRDAILYALGVGFADDEADPREMTYVTGTQVRVVPTFATMMAWDPDWVAATGINPVMSVHGEQFVAIHQPLPDAATVVAKRRIVDVFDKGDKGAVIVLETAIREKTTGAPLCTNKTVSIARGDGGFGGPRGSPSTDFISPSREPDKIVQFCTRKNQALLYQLVGDRNPLHVDPAFAQAAGFPRPILHGLCTYGIACRAVLSSACDYDANRIATFGARFVSPVFPGDTIHTVLWFEGDHVLFRATVPNRSAVVLDRGVAVLRH